MTPRAHPKRTVEDCIALNVSSLVRPGLFRAPPGALCSSTWRDSKQRETLRIYFWWELLQTGQSFLHINERRHSPSSPVSSIDAQNIEIVETRLHFGSRRWFKCPGLAGGVLCEQGAGILYLPANESRFACRKCHGLLHRSAQTHDKRVDALLRLPPSEFQFILTNGSFRQRLLAVQACSVALRRLRRKAASSRASRSSAMRSPARDFGNNSRNKLGTEHPGTP